MKNILTAGIILALLFSTVISFAQDTTQPVNDYAILKVNYRDFYFSVQYSMIPDTVYSLNRTLNFPKAREIPDSIIHTASDTYLLKCFDHLDKKGFEFVSELYHDAYLFRKKHKAESK